MLGGSAGLTAQQEQLAGPKASMDQAAIERSWNIQKALSAIESNRDAFIDSMLSSWSSQIGPGYDLWSELADVLKTATPWRLYGASLAPDLTTAIDVLRGRASAGQYISGDNPSIGQTTSQLVFTPIAPCRIVDTRNPGARTGLLTAGVTRTFDLTTGGYAKGQGGATSGCTGLPSFSPKAWGVNITVVGYSAGGALTVWPFSEAAPLSSLLNYFPASPAIANNGSVTGCYGCGEDINVSPFAGSGQTHVIIDVNGYYEQATGFATGTPVVTRLAGTTTNVAAGGFISIAGGNCPAGTVLIGGGQTNSSQGTILTSDHHVSGAHWYEYVKNNGGSAETVTIYSTCLEVN
jgi:hypothetical protein